MQKYETLKTQKHNYLFFLFFFNNRSEYRILMAESGAKGLMKGLGPRILAMAPASVLIVSVYELIKRLSRKTEPEIAAAAAAAKANAARGGGGGGGRGVPSGGLSATTADS